MSRMTKEQRLALKGKILGLMSPTSPYSTKEIAQLAEISWVLAKKTLESMEAEGKVVCARNTIVNTQTKWQLA